jgi:Ni/Fe-hydrogenase 1 B-type cytochrome subunit
MAQNNISVDTPLSPFLQRHSALIRIWHWLTFIVLTGSLITVLLASTLLHPWENIGMVKEQLQQKGVVVTDDQAFAVSHEYEDKVWDVHKLLGFGLAFLLFSRIVIEMAQPGDEKVRSRMKNAMRLNKLDDGNKNEYRHYLCVKRIYLLFYLLLAYMAITGLGLAFGRVFSFLGKIHRELKEIHGIGQYVMYAFIFLHLCGVIIADNRKAKGLVSGMIHGNREMN